jgi:hypothetical protein
LGQRHGKAVHAGLGSGVVGLPELAFLAVNGRNIDDTAKTAFYHAIQYRFHHIEQRIQIGLDDGVPVILGLFLESAIAGNAALFTSTSTAPTSACALASMAAHAACR